MSIALYLAYLGLCIKKVATKEADSDLSSAAGVINVVMLVIMTYNFYLNIPLRTAANNVQA